jgi:hypothetical protein
MCAALLAIIAAAALSSPAFAAVPNVTVSYSRSPIDSTASKQVRVSCQNGEVLIGAGAAVSAPSGTVAIKGIVPTRSANGGSTPFGAVISAVEVGAGTTKNWSMTGYATCARIPATQGQVKVVSVSSANDSQNLKSAYAECPSDMKLIGALGTVTSGVLNKVTLTQILPFASLKRVYATGAETHGGTTSSWSVTAHAICGKGAAFADVELVSASGSPDSQDAKAVVASCPTGKKVIGAAGAIDRSDGTVIVTTMSPLSNQGSYTHAVETGSGTTGTWFPIASAFCATY